MQLSDKIKMIFHVLRWRLTWSKRDLDYKHHMPGNPKFITAREAIRMIKDGSVVLSSGMAGSGRCSVFFWAIRDAFLKNGHPSNLTWVNVGAQGGRGKVPGTVDEMALPGLVTNYISGHFETTKAMLKLASLGWVELHTLPQGAISQLLELQAEGESEHHSTVGMQTFLDPECGRGSAVTPQSKNRYIESKGDCLSYTIPKIEVVLMNVPYADEEGNLYFHHASSITEHIQATRAAKANNGIVLATVSAIIPKDASRISLEAGFIDGIVLHPYNEQSASIRQHNYWPMFTVGARVNPDQAVEKLRFINKMLKITPVRSEIDQALARLAASLFSEVVPEDAVINIGVGYPEEVCRLIFEQHLDAHVTFTSETGVYGGMPAPGIFFGTAINPEQHYPSSWMFEFYQENLDAAILGFLQVDAAGNVNVSKRGPEITDYVGPGGFPDIVNSAKTLIFVGSWMSGGTFSVANGKLTLKNQGKPKFVKQVDEITFSGRQALNEGKSVYFVSHVGVFQLTERGVEIIRIMPGIDLQRDILDACDAKIVVPASGRPEQVDASVVTGKDFHINWDKQPKTVMQS